MLKDEKGLQARFVELRSLFEISQTLNSSLHLKFILDNILLTSMGRLMVSKGIILLNKGDDKFQVETLKGIPQDLIGKKLHIPSPSKSLLILDREDRSSWTSTLKELGIEIVLPMTSSDRNLGLIGFGRKMRGGDYTQSEIEFLTSLANIAATAVDKGVAFQQLQEANRKLDRKIQQLSTLFEIGRELNSTLNSEKILNILAYALMGEMMIQHCLIFLKDEGKMQLKLIKGSSNSEQVEEMIAASEEFSTYLSQITEPQRVSTSPLSDLGIIVLIPMRIQEETKGIIAIGDRATGEDYKDEELEFLSTLGNQAMISLENARLFEEALEKQRMEEELAIAREIQRGLLPKAPPDIEGYDIEGVNLPSKQVGGDYYDFIKIDDVHYGIAIADVSGKGPPAALLMANLQASLRALASEYLSPREMIFKINNLIFRNTDIDTFITFFYGILDTKRRTFTYTNAGHNPPYLFHQDGSLRTLTEGGLILGMMESVIYGEERIQLAPGDLIVMFTDGVTEAINQQEEEFGEERLVKIIQQNRSAEAKQLINKIKDSLRRFAGGVHQNDDITVVVMRIN